MRSVACLTKQPVVKGSLSSLAQTFVEIVVRLTYRPDIAIAGRKATTTHARTQVHIHLFGTKHYEKFESLFDLTRLINAVTNKIT